MIDADRDGVVTFEIPFTLAGLRSPEMELTPILRMQDNCKKGDER